MNSKSKSSTRTGAAGLLAVAAIVTLAACGPETETAEEAPVAPGTERAPDPAVNNHAPPPHLIEAIEEFVVLNGDSLVPPFRYALTDLNDDDRDDGIVLLTGPAWCAAGGCTLLVARDAGDGFIVFSTSTLTNEPILASLEQTGGWHDLIVDTPSKGNVVLRFDGAAYPSNPSLQAPATASQISAAKPLAMMQAEGAAEPAEPAQ